MLSAKMVSALGPLLRKSTSSTSAHGKITITVNGFVKFLLAWLDWVVFGFRMSAWNGIVAKKVFQHGWING
jgi:hypothetical protein